MPSLVVELEENMFLWHRRRRLCRLGLYKVPHGHLVRASLTLSIFETDLQVYRSCRNSYNHARPVYRFHENQICTRWRAHRYGRWDKAQHRGILVSSQICIMSFTKLTLSTAFMGSNPLGTYNLSHPPPSTPPRTSRTKQKWPPEPSKNVWLPPRHRYHRIFQRWPSPLLSLLRLLQYPTFPHTLFSLLPFPLASNFLLQYIILSLLFSFCPLRFSYYRLGTEL